MFKDVLIDCAVNFGIPIGLTAILYVIRETAKFIFRIAYTMELDPRYFDVIVKRWQKFTGKQAERKEL